MSVATSSATSATSRPATIRDTAPDYLAPIDDRAGQRPHPGARSPTTSAADSPEHDWAHARDLDLPGVPAGRDAGPRHRLVRSRRRSPAHGAQSHAQPLLDVGPAGLPVVYTIDAGAYDIVVNGDHLLSWGIEPSEIQDAAMRNLALVGDGAWTDEVSGDRRLVSSDTGDGWDAARILLPEVVAHLTTELGSVRPHPGRAPRAAPADGGLAAPR